MPDGHIRVRGLVGATRSAITTIRIVYADAETLMLRDSALSSRRERAAVSVRRQLPINSSSCSPDGKRPGR